MNGTGRRRGTVGDSVRPQRDELSPLRVVISTRISDDRGGDAVPHQTQEAGCRRKAAEMGATVVAVVRDEDIGGDRLDRPGLNRAIEMIAGGEADVLMTYATDRLARDQVALALIVHRVRRSNGEVLSATEDLEQGPLGDFMRFAYGFAGQVELLKIRERTNRSFTARYRATGKLKPGPKPPFGYRKEGRGPDSTYHEHRAEASVVRRIWDDAAAGLSRGEISRRLNAEGVPAPGGGAWSGAAVTSILQRDVYWTGQHEADRWRTARDADNRPYREQRPPEERYLVPGFPVLVEPATAERAKARAGRNRWKTRRADRNPHVGLLRYGFAVCGCCERSLSVIDRADLRPHYSCSAGSLEQPCAARASVAVEELDRRVWEWVEEVICDPRRANAYHLEPRRLAPTAEQLAALSEAEAQVDRLERQEWGLLSNLSLLTESAAALAAKRVNALDEELVSARRDRDRLAAEVALASGPTLLGAKPHEAAAAAVLDAIDAMKRAEPEPERSRPLVWWMRRGDRWEPAITTVPDSWEARRAALSVLGVTVKAYRRGSAPRWEAEMVLPQGTLQAGEALTAESTPRRNGTLSSRCA